MNSSHETFFRLTRRICVSAVLMFGLTACGEGPGSPRPPQSPPRPVMMSGGYFSTAQLLLPARPVLPRPGMM
jgi:hypothetical protein